MFRKRICGNLKCLCLNVELIRVESRRSTGSTIRRQSISNWYIATHFAIYFVILGISSTYDHRLQRTGHPVRSGPPRPSPVVST